ncbi:MFS transporter [bacterium]|nr:MFS transporter [bacterium]
MSGKHGFPKTVIKLGYLSFFTDMSSEMIFPLLPVFLKSLPGGGPFVLGIIEGIAESTASFLKLVSGLWADRIKKRTPFVVAGYGIASVVRPLIALATVWPAVLVLRFLDRVGKGLRSSPRDAIIADEVPPERRGAAFGLQRIMDHAGAVAGPVIVFLLMNRLGFSIRHVIMFAAIPAAVVLAILSTLREPPHKETPAEIPSPAEKAVMSRDFRLLLAAVLVFTLGNSSDAFLLMRLSNAGVDAQYVALLWGLHHVVKIAGAWFGGRTSDVLGRKALMITGLGLYALIYAAFGMIGSGMALVVIFIVYGASIGILEPTERAWVSELTAADKRGTAFGVYHASIGFGALPASIMFGFLWNRFGQGTAFITGAGLAFVSAVIVMFVRQRQSPNQ